MINSEKSNKSNEIKGWRQYSCSVTIGKRGRPGTRRIKTEVFLGINISSSRYSEIARDKATIKHCNYAIQEA